MLSFAIRPHDAVLRHGPQPVWTALAVSACSASSVTSGMPITPDARPPDDESAAPEPTPGQTPVQDPVPDRGPDRAPIRPFGPPSRG
jgi:hypothetical protein